MILIQFHVALLFIFMMYKRLVKYYVLGKLFHNHHFFNIYKITGFNGIEVKYLTKVKKHSTQLHSIRVL